MYKGWQIWGEGNRWYAKKDGETIGPYDYDTLKWLIDLREAK